MSHNASPDIPRTPDGDRLYETWAVCAIGRAFAHSVADGPDNSEPVRERPVRLDTIDGVAGYSAHRYAAPDDAHRAVGGRETFICYVRATDAALDALDGATDVETLRARRFSPDHIATWLNDAYNRRGGQALTYGEWTGRSVIGAGDVVAARRNPEVWRVGNPLPADNLGPNPPRFTPMDQ